LDWPFDALGNRGLGYLMARGRERELVTWEFREKIRFRGTMKPF